MALTSVDKAFRDYLTALAEYEARGARNEGATRFAFQSLLDDVGRTRGLTLLAERRIRLPNGGHVVVDGELVDGFNVRRGVWEAKRPGEDLGRALEEKLGAGYPEENLLLENTREALLLQNGEVRGTFSLRDATEAETVLLRFTGYRAPEMDRFEAAAAEFERHLPHLAAELERVVERQKKSNRRFRAALDELLDLCRSSINPATHAREVEDMLRQHLLAERIFRSVFRNPDFVARNPVARQVQRVVAELVGPHFSSVELFGGCEEFYRAVEAAAATIEAYENKQQFLHTVYERFFQRVSAATADTHGIVYTPDEIVRWMVRSVDLLLRAELGVKLEEPGVKVLDPCTGTGKFLVELLRHVDVRVLDEKFRNDFFANEVLLLPYYIAAQNAEWEHYSRVGAYEPFPGICFADTLDMQEGKQIDVFAPENTERLRREEEAPIQAIVGNPPYNVGQQNENDNNRNRRYEEVDGRIRATYARDSAASSSARLYDMYVRFFRWSADRLRGRAGVVALVTNASFLDQVAFDGMRRDLLREFSEVYVLDLGGNVRRNPRLSGSRHNAFGIQVGVAITLLVRRPGWRPGERGTLRYARLGEYWTRMERLAYLREHPDYTAVEWEELTPDARHNWLNAGIASGWEEMLPLGRKRGERDRGGDREPIFRAFTLGANTNRDAWVYGFDRERVLERVRRLVDTYNGDVGRWRAAGGRGDLDALVTADEERIKWSSRLKEYLRRGVHGEVEPERMRRALYRPFCERELYFAPLLVHRPGLFDRIYPTAESEEENLTLCVTDGGSEKPFMTLATRRITDLHLAGAGAGTQCFPLYLYDDEGQRVPNVSASALEEFRARCGSEVEAEDLLHYVYALLHAPGYRERYAANLRRSLPRVPRPDAETFAAFARAGRTLVRLHARFDEVEPWPLEEVSTSRPRDYRVTRMRLLDGGTSLVVNRAVTLRGIPPEAADYRVGARTALEWVVDQHRLRTDRRSGIVDDPNDPERPREIVERVERVVRVSVETARIVAALPEVEGSERA